MQTATWKFAVTTKPTASTAAVVLDYLEKPIDVLYVRRRNSYCELTLEIENRNDLHALSGAAYRRCILGIRNNVPRLHGQITEHAESSRGVTITAKDPYFNLSWRRFWADLAYNSLGDGEIAMRMIEQVAADEPHFLKRGTIQSGATRSRKAEIGQRVSERVEYLASLVGSFAFTIDASFGVVGELSKFNSHVPYDGIAPRARFEFGQDTLNNVLDYQRAVRPLVNRANITGKYGGWTYAESISGRNAYGLWEDERGQVDINERDPANTATLQQIADSYVQDEPHYALTLTPGPDAPLLFNDFDVTDSAQVLIKNFGIERRMTRAITECAIRLDPASGVENVESLTLDDPDEV